MSSLRSAYATIKNFVVNLVTQGGDGEANYRREFPTVSGGRKRVATNVFEPEITDDEDDVGSGISPVYKRFRVDTTECEMASEKSKEQMRYVTRGSGLNPAIEGLTKQPWEFDFSKRSKSRSSSRTKQTSDASRVVPARSTIKLVPSSSKSAHASQGPSSMLMGTYDSQLKNSQGKSLELQAAKISTNFFGRNGAETKSKEIEVITLDDEERTAQPSTCSKVNKSYIFPVPSSRRELALNKPRFTTTMKSRDSNRFTKCLKDVGHKLIGQTCQSAIRLNEMQDYKKLLEQYNIMTGGISSRFALSKRTLKKPELEVMYKRFDGSPTKGAVTIKINRRSLTDSLKESQNLVDPSSRSTLYPRLYSTPKENVTMGLTSKSSASALPLEQLPVVEGFEAGSKTERSDCISPISPLTNRRSYTFAAQGNNATLLGNFTNLEDALNKSVLPDAEPSGSDKEILEISTGGTDESTPGDDDLSIIAEKIVNKSRKIAVNTLALEQTSCPYVQKSWLTESVSTWKDDQKHREARIREESETMDVLRRESTLEKDLEERIRKKLTLTEIIVLEEPPAKLPELTDDIRQIIDHAKARGNDNEVLAQVRLLKDTISVLRGDVKTLGPSQWLNDNVINTYMGLIVLRSKSDNYPSVYAFQTFFYPKLLKEGYSNSLKRWTRKDDIFAHDMIILPIHLGLHWCLACIDFRKKIIRYFDSLGGDNNKCLNSLLEYISREMKERKQIDLDKSEWKLLNVKGIPQQQNGSDCGMFACKFAEYLSRDADFTFTQENMPYYRDRMIYELIKQDLMCP